MSTATPRAKAGRRTKVKALHPDIRMLLLIADKAGGLTVREISEALTAAGRPTSVEIVRRTVGKMPDTYISHFEPVNYTWTPVWKVVDRPVDAVKPKIKITKELQRSYN